MLEKLTIKDFQAHASFEVLFASGITTLVGRSDVGKSSVLRALKWLMTNRPAGEAFIRDGAGCCSVALWLDNGRIVTRGKGKDANVYDLDGKVFKAFGQDVPEEIARLLNVEAVNFAGQHDAPYWLGLSPGQVSRELNALVNLDAMDRSLADVNARLRKAQAAAEVSADRLKAARERRDGLAWVTELDADLRVLERQENSCQAIIARASLVASLAESGALLAAQARNAADAALDAGKVVVAGDRLAELRGRADRLQYILTCIAELDSDLGRVRGELAAAEAELGRLAAGACPLCGRRSK